MHHSSERGAIWAVVDVRRHPSAASLWASRRASRVPSDHYCVGDLLLLGTLGSPAPGGLSTGASGSRWPRRTCLCPSLFSHSPGRLLRGTLGIEGPVTRPHPALASPLPRAASATTRRLPGPWPTASLHQDTALDRGSVITRPNRLCPVAERPPLPHPKPGWPSP